MNIPEELRDRKVDRAELLITLPPDWDISSNDEKWHWPIRLLRNLARMPIRNDNWMGYGHTVSYEGTFAENTEFCGVMLTLPYLFGPEASVCELPNGDEVNFYQILPLYENEMNFKIESSAAVLEELFPDDFDMVVAVARKNVLSSKKWHIPAHHIEDLFHWDEAEGCFATDRIMVDGCKVGYMYREEPDGDFDSGWRFTAGDESGEYMDNPDNSGIYSLNVVANNDPEIIPFLTSPCGSYFARDENGVFVGEVPEACEDGAEEPLEEQLKKWIDADEYEKIIAALESFPRDELDLYNANTLARAYSNSQRYDDAYELLRGRHEEGEDDMAWNWRMGLCEHMLGKYSDAVEHLKRAIELGDDYEETEGYLRLAAYCMENGNCFDDLSNIEMLKKDFIAQTYRCKEHEGNMFWRIEFAGSAFVANFGLTKPDRPRRLRNVDYCAFVVYHGKIGTGGEYRLMAFDRPDICEIEARKLVASKMKIGYEPYAEFDPDGQLYIDDDVAGPHPLTSHPNFRAHFEHELYYDLGYWESPFGNGHGAEALWRLQNEMRKNSSVDLYEFFHRMVSELCEAYIPPDSLDAEGIRAVPTLPDDGTLMFQHIIDSDRVVIATALGQIKTTGETTPWLKELALRSMKRLLLLAEIGDYGFGSITQKMMGDLESFDAAMPQ